MITADPGRAQTSLRETEALLNKRHLDWHPWKNGDLGQFNQALHAHPQRGVHIPDSLQTLIRLSTHYYQLTEGRFNPALGALISAWGFHQSTQPDHQRIEQIKRNLPGMQDLVINDQLAFSNNPFLQLDFGAIAKGLAVSEIAELLTVHSINDFIINAGGDIYASGSNLKRPWRVAIEDPFQPGVIADLELASGMSIFTSGNYHRRYTDENNIPRHHIIDPSSGEPSRQISAATVIHADPVIADIAATTLMLTETAGILSMAGKLGITDFLVITESKDVFINQQLAQRIHWLKPDDFTLHVF